MTTNKSVFLFGEIVIILIMNTAYKIGLNEVSYVPCVHRLGNSQMKMQIINLIFRIFGNIFKDKLA